MSKQPTALRLADALEAWTLGKPTRHHKAAAELRRLHAEVNELKRTLALQQQSYEREIQIEVEAEREACAKVCDERESPNLYGKRECAAAIRARGQEA
jgi:hypothetical protein